ncbi:hypothetical protein O0I10_009595 [Lichtheimia ornata]|uniref:Uncharacterized protein n=1 Tax=Lichtheimia ornata TaxID=688661 RepID=A0AAD7UY90_9FUNG|nr:uncharacterized protein O0I10_009595 [Lichtheimia ornata]KAJ8654705.1 hypothetical protein O0I10_009595 [Lichtheimia ornata]
MVRLFTLTIATLGLFLTTQSVTAEPKDPSDMASGGGTEGTKVRTFMDVAKIFCGFVNGHPDDLSKVVASAENTIGGGSGPGNGSPFNPAQDIFKLSKQFCERVGLHPEGPSSSNIGTGNGL